MHAEAGETVSTFALWDAAACVAGLLGSATPTVTPTVTPHGELAKEMAEFGLSIGTGGQAESLC